MAPYIKRRNGFNRRRSAIPSKKVAVKKALAKRSNMKIAKVVKKVLAKKVETKVCQFSGSIDGRTYQSSTTQTQADATTVMLLPQGNVIGGISQAYPIIAEGIGSEQRIGQSINIKGMYVKYLLTAKPYDATFNPTPKAVYVTIWCIRPKTGQVLGLNTFNIQSGSSAILFENQFNSDSGFDGTLLDNIRTVDKNNFEVLYRKTHKIGFSGTLNTSNAVASFQNNDFNQSATGKFKIKGMPLSFDRLDMPKSQNIYMFAQVMNADNTLAGASVLPVRLIFNETIFYTDM